MICTRARGHAIDATWFAAAGVPGLARRLRGPTLERLLALGDAIASVESTLLAKRRLATAGMLFRAHPRREASPYERRPATSSSIRPSIAA